VASEKQMAQLWADACNCISGFAGRIAALRTEMIPQVGGCSMSPLGQKATLR
jgi:hypothetical protein